MSQGCITMEGRGVATTTLGPSFSPLSGCGDHYERGVGTTGGGGLPGGRKGVRAVGSVQAFLKITTHQRWHCSKNGSLIDII